MFETNNLLGVSLIYMANVAHLFDPRYRATLLVAENARSLTFC